MIQDTMNHLLDLNGDCLYGVYDDANRVMTEFQTFNAVIIGTLFIIFSHQLLTLNRFYRPLARLVNISLILQLLAAFFYAVSYPYAEGKGNCIEIVISEMAVLVITFAEFHQIYVIANILGVGSYKFPLFGSLNNMLSYLTILTFVSSVLSFCLYGEEPTSVDHRQLLEEFWSITASGLQIYCIYLAREKFNHRDEENCTNDLEFSLMAPTDPIVGLFEKMSLCQVLISCFTLCTNYTTMNYMHRNHTSYAAVVPIITVVSRYGSVIYILDAVGNLLFYIKILIINERSKVSVELVVV